MEYCIAKDKNDKNVYWKIISGNKKKRTSKKEAEKYFSSPEGKVDKFKSEDTPFFFVDYEETLFREVRDRDVSEGIDYQIKGAFGALEEAKKYALKLTKKYKTLEWRFVEEGYGRYTASQEVEKKSEEEDSEVEETIYFDITIKDGDGYES